MKDYKLQTPEGVRDYLDKEMIIKDEIANRLKKLYQSFSYMLIETPSFEYLDVFNDSTIQNKNIYQFINRKGEILALRSDMTKSISRVIANKMIKRLCYQSNIFRYSGEYHASSNEFTQCGIELIDDSVKADTEAIILAINSFLTIGINNFSIHIGDTEFIRSLIESLKDSKRAYEAIKKSDGVMLEEVLKESHEDELFDILLELTSRIGKYELLEKIMNYFPNNERLIRLKKVYEALGEYQKYVSFDFSLISYGDYYNGIRFNGFVKGVGEAVLNGGRYITKKSSVGFGININLLLDKVNYESNIKTAIINYDDAYASNAYKKALELINDGYNVLMNSKEEADLVINFCEVGK